MKIAYILADPGIGLFGTKGASVHAQEMIRALRALGHHVTVYCLKRGDVAGDAASESVPQDLVNLPVFVLPVAGAKGAATREESLLRASSRLAALAREDDYDMVYERYALFSTAGAQITAGLRHRKGTEVPFIVEVNAPLISEQSRHRSLHYLQAAEETTGRTFTAASTISCVSEPVATWVQQMLRQQSPTHHRQSEPHGNKAQDHTTPPDSTASKVVVIPNGVNTERFHPRGDTAHRQAVNAEHLTAGSTVATSSEQQGQSGVITLGFLGTFKPWHGLETLLEAYTQVHCAGSESIQWRLQLIGDGPLRQQLVDEVSRYGMSEHVEFLGAVAPEMVPELLSHWDIAVAPYPAESSHYFSPLKVYEYLAAGLPIVASEVGVLHELIEHNSTGLLIPGSDPTALAQALQLLQAEPGLRLRLGEAARAVAVAEHSWNARAATLLATVTDSAHSDDALGTYTSSATSPSLGVS